MRPGSQARPTLLRLALLLLLCVALTSSQCSIWPLAGSPASTPGGTDGVNASALFSAPRGLEANSTHAFLADSGNHVIRAIELATGRTSTLAGSGVPAFASGVGTAAGLSSPYALAAASDGSALLIADSANHLVRLLNLSTLAVSPWAGTGAGGFGDGPAADARFSFPRDRKSVV